MTGQEEPMDDQKKVIKKAEIENVEIVKRFFKVLEALIKKDEIPHLSYFAYLHEDNKSYLHLLKSEPSRKLFQLKWVSTLMSVYGVSAEYLFLGTGEMFTYQNSPKDGKVTGK